MPMPLRLISRQGLLTLAAINALASIHIVQPSHLSADTGPPSKTPHQPTEITTFSSPSLRVTPTLERFRGREKRATDNPALSDFVDSYGTDWEIRWDRASDRPHLLQGPGIPLLPQSKNFKKPAVGESTLGSRLTLPEVEAAARRFLIEIADLLRVNPADLVLDPEHSRASGQWRQLWFLEFKQTHGGLPVEGARVYLRINHGHVVQFGTDRVADVILDIEPTVASSEVFETALRAHTVGPEQVSITMPAELKIFPIIHGNSYDHLLVWEMEFRHGHDGRLFRWRLDAHRGELLEIANLEVNGQVSGQIHSPYSPQLITVPLAELWVQHQGLRQTDASGAFDYLGGEASASLEGGLIEIDDACGPTHLVSWDGELDFTGSLGTDCSAPIDGGSGNTQAARDAYHHLTTSYRTIIDLFPTFPWPQPLVARTNQPNLTCEASWNGSQGSFTFSQSSQECTNPGEVPGILLHEMGHAADLVLGGISADGASGEAQSDIFAFLQNNDTCIGRGLRPGSPCLNCNENCTGVRDLLAFVEASSAPIAKPANLHAPDGLSCDRFTCPYPGGEKFQGPLGYQAHCESQIASSAVMDLYRELVTLRGAIAGGTVFENLWYASLPTFGEAYRRSNPGQVCQAEAGAADGCGASNWYTVLLAADDDDGNLANGSPNGCRIWQAFNAHGISCGSQPACFCKNESGSGGVADAGPDVTICRQEMAVLGNPNSNARRHQWLPGGQATPQIAVSPDHTTEYTLSTVGPCGETQDSVTVHVVSCDGFEEDFEDGSEGWAMSGFWHAVDSTPCVSPSASNGSSAMYFGKDETCQVGSKDSRPRDLISPQIVVDPEAEVLSFDYFLATHLEPTRLGRAEVAVKIEGTTNWQPRWAVEIADLQGDVWQTSPQISLSRFRGETIRLRFRFEAYPLAASTETYLGWLVDNVKVFDGQKFSNTVPPTVTLIEAPDRPISECECVSCRFLAVDSEGRDISELLAWSSSLDGPITAGSQSVLLLSPGDHILTGTATDYSGLSSSLSVPVSIFEDSAHCGPDGWPPAEPRLHCKDDDD